MNKIRVLRDVFMIAGGILLFAVLTCVAPAVLATCTGNESQCQQRAAQAQRRPDEPAQRPVVVPQMQMSQQNERSVQQQSKEQLQLQQRMQQHQQERLQQNQIPAPAVPTNNYRPEASRIPTSQLPRSPAVTDAYATLQQLNNVRAGYRGINQQPIPNGDIKPMPGGVVKVNTNDGRQLIFRRDGTLASFNGQGTSATLFPNGLVRSLHSNGLDVTRTTSGTRIVRQQLADQTIVISTGAQSGYVQRPVSWHGQQMVQRTIVNNGRSYSRVYGRYTWHGVVLVYYMPVIVYNPYYYGWAYFPWSVPLSYDWAFANAPWYLDNENYFMTSPDYTTPESWITDQMFGDMMQSSYIERQQIDQSQPPDYATDDAIPAPVYATADTPLTPVIKQAVANQVGQQVLLENAVAKSPQDARSLTSLPWALTPGHLFIVSQVLSVTGSAGQTCSLTPGDVLQLIVSPDPDAITADLIVTASRKLDCPVNIQVSIALADLQEMQNDFRYQVDRGLQSLNSQQGQAGFPVAPASAYNPPPVVSSLPPALGDASFLVSGAQLQADEEEAQLARAAFSN